MLVMKKISLGIVVVLFLVGFVVAQNCPPAPPKSFSGIVSHNGEVLEGEYEIRAMKGNHVAGLSEVNDGSYYIDVSPCWGSTGQIKFVINGVEANELGIYDGKTDWGVVEELDLVFDELPPETDTCGNGVVNLGEECDGANLAGRSVTDCGNGFSGIISCNSQCKIDYSNCAVPYCGDATCNNGETCSTCAGDCGACVPANTGGNNNGGSSGGSSGGSRNRNSNSNTNSDTTTQNISTTVTADLENNDSIDLSGLDKSAPITGAAISEGTKVGIGVGVVLLIIIIGIILMSLKKGEKKEVDKKDEK